MSDSEKDAVRISKSFKDKDMKKSDLITFRAFLESVPPTVERKISDLRYSHVNSQIGLPPIWVWELSTPDIRLHCPVKTCRGLRNFKCQPVSVDNWNRKRNIFLTYVCRNCGVYFKAYALQIKREDEEGKSGAAVKFGEIPSFGPPLPPRLISMAGRERELFLKGWRAENQGLGIGSFSYYRRVVEQQKDHILTEIHKAVKRLGADNELLSSIDRAKRETRFTDAIDLVKDAMPDGLKVKGHNPLRLLHRALSKGVHELDDKQCLEQAQGIRIILNELVSNMARVTKDERKIDDALRMLLQ